MSTSSLKKKELPRITEQAIFDETDEFFMIWVLIAQVKASLLKARQKEYAQFNINSERRAVLSTIHNNREPSTPVEISYQLVQELHSVTAMLKRMEKEGLIKRCKSNSRSRFAVELTQKGIEVYYHSRYNQADKRILSILTKKERERLISSLLKVRNQAFVESGIPVWRIKYPVGPNNLNNGGKT